MRNWLRSCSVAALLVGAAPAAAHHGTASIAAIGTEGPGAAIDTTSPLPLGQGTAFGLVKTEYARFTQREGFTAQKQFSSFHTLALGYGFTPWLSVFVFQPLNVKSQDEVGTNTGVGDPNAMLALSFKWDEGLRLAPEKESLDELEDWHFGVWASCSAPLGSTEHRDDQGAFYAPDMQTGFRGPSPALGLSLLKQLSADFTLLGEANFQTFFEQDYGDAGYRYKFGSETRGNGAIVYRAAAWDGGRLDVAPELSVLHLQRDEADGVALDASGGTILYGQLGLRATLGALSIAAAVKRAAVSSLNEGDDQQGSEGLEQLRASLTLGWAKRF